MVRKTQALAKYQEEPSLTLDQTIRLLRAQRDKGKQLFDNRPITSAANMIWETVTPEVISRVFAASSPNVTSIMSVGKYAFAYGGSNEQERERQRIEDIATRL